MTFEGCARRKNPSDLQSPPHFGHGGPELTNGGLSGGSSIGAYRDTLAREAKAQAEATACTEPERWRALDAVGSLPPWGGAARLHAAARRKSRFVEWPRPQMTRPPTRAASRKELPPYANAIHASICIAAHVMTDRSAGDGARAENHTRPCDATGRITDV